MADIAVQSVQKYIYIYIAGTNCPEMVRHVYLRKHHSGEWPSKISNKYIFVWKEKAVLAEMAVQNVQT